LGGRISAFRDDAERLECWRQNRERLMAGAEAGWRPTGWWDYESPAERDHSVFEPIQLYEMGELRPDEIAAARRLIEERATAPGVDPVKAADLLARMPPLPTGVVPLLGRQGKRRGE
jgi:hypothetical protein